MATIAADPQHLGARIGITAVLHTWGSAMTHHPHIHMIVPGGGISLDGQRWISSRPAFLLPVRVLGKLFRRLFLARLLELHTGGRLQFFGAHAGLTDRRAFNRHLAPARKKSWIVYAKPPFSGPEAVLAYLSRYTHRVAISNHRLISFDKAEVTFRYKNYRQSGTERHRTMTLHADEFIRRFLLHVLPTGFHRIRHYGLLATGGRKLNIRPSPRTPRGPDDGNSSTRRVRSTHSKATVPLLRRAHGRHRRLRAHFPGTRSPAFSPASRIDGVVTRHGQIQSLVEVPPLREIAPSRPQTFGNDVIATADYATIAQIYRPWQRRIGAFKVSPHVHRCRASTVGHRRAAAFGPAPDTLKPHSVPPVARGFVHERLSDAGPPLVARAVLAGIR